MTRGDDPQEAIRRFKDFGSSRSMGGSRGVGLRVAVRYQCAAGDLS